MKEMLRRSKELAMRSKCLEIGSRLVDSSLWRQASYPLHLSDDSSPLSYSDEPDRHRPLLQVVWVTTQEMQPTP